jgi:hypothetical protein
LINAIQNDVAWNQTVKSNSLNKQAGSGYFGCVAVSTGCAAMANQTPVPLDILDVGGNVIGRGSAAQAPVNGYDLQGNPCVASSTAPCPIQLSLTWTAACGSTSTDPNCNFPLFTVYGTFSLAQGTKIGPLNLSNFNFSFARTIVPVAACPSPAPAVSASCTTNYVCTPSGWQCTPANTSCNGGNIQWPPGSSTLCEGIISMASNSDVQSISTLNSEQGNYGGAVFQCNSGTWVFQSGNCYSPSAATPVNGTCGTLNFTVTPHPVYCEPCGDCFVDPPTPSFSTNGTLCATGYVDTTNPPTWGWANSGAIQGVSASDNTNDPPFTWTCDGTGGGSNSTCSQSVQIGLQAFCFPPGSMVLLADGLTQKRIEDVVPGDSVLSYDEVTGNFFPDRVLHRMDHAADNRSFEHFILGNGTELSATTNHPIMVWKNGQSQYLTAEEIEGRFNANFENDLELQYYTGEPIAIDSIVPEERHTAVYNLSVEGSFASENFEAGHNFIVNGVLVHNKNHCPPGM